MRAEAKELINKFQHEDKESYCLSLEEAKQCALISIEETLQTLYEVNNSITPHIDEKIKELKDVRESINRNN